MTARFGSPLRQAAPRAGNPLPTPAGAGTVLSLGVALFSPATSQQRLFIAAIISSDSLKPILNGHTGTGLARLICFLEAPQSIPVQVRPRVSQAVLLWIALA